MKNSVRPSRLPRIPTSSSAPQLSRTTFAPPTSFSPAGKISRQSPSSSRSAEASAAESSFSALNAYQRCFFPRRRRSRGIHSPLIRLRPRLIRAVKMPMLHRAKTMPSTRPAVVTGDRSP